MDTQRLILFFVFAFSIMLLWDAWQKANRPPAPTRAIPGMTQPGVPAPALPEPAPAAQASATEAIPPAQAASLPKDRNTVKVSTDVFRAEIDLQGGDIVYLELLQHRDTADTSKNFVLFTPEYRYAAQSGLIGPGLPTHKTLYSAAGKQEIVLPEGKDSVEVRLEAAGPEGVKVYKILTFRRGSYLIDIAHEIVNASATPVAANGYFQLTRDDKHPPGDTAMMKTYLGAAMYTDQEKFKKLQFDDIAKGKMPKSLSEDNGWIGLVQHYFVSALIPSEKLSREFYARKLAEDFYSAGVVLPAATVAPGNTTRLSLSLYAGPQEQGKLKNIAPGLELVVDYGWLTVIAAPLFWVLELFHGWLANWGLAIILLTIAIKLIFFPLSAASYRSMARMKLVAPKLTKLREQYGDDRVRMNQAMMELYKTEKINPLGGCLPILVQIPVFISLYWVLLAAVELRHAPFYGWITDLSAPDPWYILPALMMVSMIIQTKMNPAPPDPVQAKVMMIMPFAFGITFFFFPSGLVLYWFVNNILSILQQWQIQRLMEGKKPSQRR